VPPSLKPLIALRQGDYLPEVQRFQRLDDVSYSVSRLENVPLLGMVEPSWMGSINLSFFKSTKDAPVQRKFQKIALNSKNSS
jgi:hypothetical protein